ncbi:MAG: DNA polymerase III subunit delta' [Deltaproteobacteria bacterium]|nr:DNA polymerase III subunit delta' [Deltaproteobacteria bacterium]
MAANEVMTFAAVRGHARAIAQLQAAHARERLAHALLITGLEGIGKQRLANAMATWLACTAGAGDACGQCSGCRQMAAGTHPDMRIVTVPSGKKDIRIDAVRGLRSFMQLTPLNAPYKVAIIHDAHALNLNAQNALLKTLEEPPPRSLLILVTHSPGTLLPTVRSRCQRIPCAPLPDSVVVDILGTHGVPADEARVAAAYAEGSPGRALQLRGELGARRQQLLNNLAELPTAGYVRATQMIHDATGRDEPTLPLALIWSWYRDQAVVAAGADVGLRNADFSAVPPVSDATIAVRHADAVADALAQVRRGNPNRQLLLEALFLRLGR